MILPDGMVNTTSMFTCTEIMFRELVDYHVIVSIGTLSGGIKLKEAGHLRNYGYS